MLRVVLERAVGDVELPAAVRIVAAASPAEQAADGWELVSLRRQSDTVAAARLTLSSGVSSEHQRVRVALYSDDALANDLLAREL